MNWDTIEREIDNKRRWFLFRDIHPDAIVLGYDAEMALYYHISEQAAWRAELNPQMPPTWMGLPIRYMDGDGWFLAFDMKEPPATFSRENRF